MDIHMGISIYVDMKFGGGGGLRVDLGGVR